MGKKSKTLIDIRKLVIMGNARGVTLPKDWLEDNNVKLGDRLLLKVEKADLKFKK